MDQEHLQQFRAEVIARKNLPTIPAVLAQILQLVDKENTSAKDLIGVIEHDQALTGKILRLANSAFFGQARRVATIPRAVMLLGFSTVRNLALGVKVWDALAGGLARQRLEQLWAHAVLVAVSAKQMAGKLRAGDPDEAFTAGLLHDVGRIVLAQRFKEDYWKVVGGAAESEPVEAIEQATFGVDHSEVGAWLLEAWELPPAIVEAARAHHAIPAKSGTAGLVSIANRLVAWTDMAKGTVRPEAESVFAMAAERGVTPEFWQTLIAQLRADGAFEALGSLNA